MHPQLARVSVRSSVQFNVRELFEHVCAGNSDIAGTIQATRCSLAQGIVEAVLAWKPSRPNSDCCIARGSLDDPGICDCQTVL